MRFHIFEPIQLKLTLKETVLESTDALGLFADCYPCDKTSLPVHKCSRIMTKNLKEPIVQPWKRR